MVVAEYTDHLPCVEYPYLTPEELIACCPNAVDMEVDDPAVIDAITDATLVLYYLTGRQFHGTCTTTVRPPCLSGNCYCGCSPRQVNLGVWPITDLISVRYDGVTYETTALDSTFHVNDWNYLARNDGEQFLSGNQWAVAESAQDNETDGYVFEVTFEHGLKIPRLLTRATRALACQFVAACADQECKLPTRVTSVVRAGISMDIASVSDMLKDGKTGIYEVDLAIQVFNPSKMQSPSFAWHPGISNPGRRITS